MVNYNQRLIKSIKGRNQFKKYCDAKKEGLNITELSGYELDLLYSFCYFCGEKRVIDKHHIVPRNNRGRNHVVNLIPLCPTHHAIIHRGIADIIFVGGGFLLDYGLFKYDLPYSVNGFIKRKVLLKPSELKYVHKGTKNHFEQRELNEKEIKHYKGYFDCDNKGIGKW